MARFSVLIAIAVLAAVTTPHAAAQCATLTLNPSSLDGSGDFLTVEVVDPVNPPSPLTVSVTSREEPDGETLTLQPVGVNTYSGTIPMSTRLNQPGVIFVQPHGTHGRQVRVLYFDDDFDGNGSPCPPDGQVEASVAVDLDAGRVVVRRAYLTDSDLGDDDQIPDDRETVEILLTLINKGATTLTNVKARLQTTTTEIDGILVNEIDFPDLPPGVEVESPGGFFVHLSEDADRISRGIDTQAVFAARFRIFVESAEIDSIDAPQEVAFEMDLDVAGGGSTAPLVEGFEGGFGTFSPMHLDLGLATLGAANGYRCPYHDPDNAHSNNPNDTQCYPGVDATHNADFFWRIDGPGSPDGGRAASGDRSLYFGQFGTAAPGSHTTPTGTFEAAVSDPISFPYQKMCEGMPLMPCTIDLDCPPTVACEYFGPTLSFRHQVSLMDDRLQAIPSGESLDGAVVQIQRVDVAGISFGPWETLRPYHNPYDSQRTETYTECMFDPTDDSSDEDDFFSTIDRRARLGRSSTCYDRHVFSHQGDTAMFSPTALGGAVDGPGLAGAAGAGTWVETRYDLTRFRGLRARLRFLTSTTKNVTEPTWATTPVPLNTAGDDGWFIDDVVVDSTLDAPATYVADVKDNSALPPVGAICSVVVSSLTATPPALPSGGGTTQLSADASVADRCVDGILQHRFWVDQDLDFMLDENAGDTILRGWLDEPELPVQVASTARLAVEARCSTSPTCNDTTFIDVPVGSCGDGTANGTEACDLSDLRGEDCVSLGYTGGTLGCTESCMFDTSTCTGGGPPTPGEPTQLVMASSGGGMLTASYVPAPCATDHVLYWANDLSQVAAGTYPGQICGIGTSGTHTFPDPGLPIVFFVIVGTDGAMEGSYGSDNGVQRPPDSNRVDCVLTQTLANACP